ncbi:hypothetical protein [Bacillus cereus]|uniref:hypothetical protein n=1 Tax=Bacillus cereus TaxID=1396 RepID=UPI000279D553|nr:hypothetical protein [Bacillus cereus]EJR89780.1 hypothetical protein IKG_06008 [Bacillus cereus VD200]
MKKRIQEEFIVSKILSEPKNNLRIKHKICGHEYVVSQRKFSQMKDCPACVVKQLHDKFVVEVQEMVGQEYKVVSRYKRATKTICIWHKTCNSHFRVKPQSFLKGKRCPQCGDMEFKK